MSIRINNKIISGTYTAQSYRYVGEIFQSALPIEDSRVALLDGHKIYESEGYGSFIRYITSLALLYPQLSCTEDEWQLSDTTYGECGKFVISEDGVRLPKIVSFVQGLSSLQDLATLVEAGLPNIEAKTTGQIVAQGSSVSGAFRAENSVVCFGIPNGDYQGYYDINLDASLSNSTYGNSDTVQPQSIRYPYYIVLATGVTQEVKVKEELTTNIPFTLFESKYSEVDLNNTSWLLSNGQWNSKELYPSAYNELLKNVNNGEAHFVSNKMYYFTNTGEPNLTYVITTEKAKVGQAVYGLSTGFKNYIEEVTENGFKFTDPSYGYLEFVYSPNLNNSNTYNPTDYEFIINTSEETFRLPLLDGSESLVSDRYDELELLASGSTYTAPANGFLVIKGTAGNGNFAMWTPLGMEFRNENQGALRGFVPVAKGVTVGYSYNNFTKTTFRFIYAQGNGSLYFYVGDTNINVNLVDTGKLTQEVANLIPNNSALIANFGLPSDEYIDITIGATLATYTMPADGYLAFYGNAPNTSEGGSAGMKNLTLGNFAVDSLNIWGRRTACIMPVRKNDQVEINFSNATSIRLYPLQGNKGES